MKDACIELETLGALQTLNAGDSLFYEETWETLRGEFPPTPATARAVLKQFFDNGESHGY